MVNEYVFDDGSIESKVLQYELRDANVIKVDKYNLEEWITSIPPTKETVKAYLHFCYEDYVTSEKDIRADIATLLHKYPNLRIIAQYEQADRASIKRRASNYNILVPTYQFKDNVMTKKEDVDVDKVLEENKDKVKTIDYGKYRVGGDYTEPIGKEVASDTITPEITGGHEDVSDTFVNKLREYKNKRRRKKQE